MSKVAVGSLIVLGSCLVLSLVMLFSVISTLDTDMKQHNGVSAQLDVRDIHFDKLYKVIAQKTQIVSASSEQQKELVEALVQGRAGGFVRLIHENNPESAFSREQFADLSNTIEAQREGFFREQKELIDLVRENRNLHDSAISGSILGIWGRQAVEQPTLIQSAESKSVISSGEDNNIDLGL